MLHKVKLIIKVLWNIGIKINIQILLSSISPYSPLSLPLPLSPSIFVFTNLYLRSIFLSLFLTLPPSLSLFLSICLFLISQPFSTCVYVLFSLFLSFSPPPRTFSMSVFLPRLLSHLIWWEAFKKLTIFKHVHPSMNGKETKDWCQNKDNNKISIFTNNIFLLMWLK